MVSKNKHNILGISLEIKKLKKFFINFLMRLSSGVVIFYEILEELKL